MLTVRLRNDPIAVLDNHGLLIVDRMDMKIIRRAIVADAAPTTIPTNPTHRCRRYRAELFGFDYDRPLAESHLAPHQIIATHVITLAAKLPTITAAVMSAKSFKWSSI